MNKVIVSDAPINASRVAYIYNDLSARLPAEYPLPAVAFGDRAVLTVDEAYADECFRLASESIAESVAVGMKYRYLLKTLVLSELPKAERDIFRFALLSADLSADKRYILSGLNELRTVALDGLYNFRLGELKGKWQKITECIPPDFSSAELDRFIAYLLADNREKVFVDVGRVYYHTYKPCRLGALVGAKGERRTVAEILLSGAAQVCVRENEGKGVSAFLKRYYGARTFFYGKNGKNS